MSSTSTGTSQGTKSHPQPGVLAGPVVSALADESTAGIAALDARWAALVLAGQAIDYAVTPGPGDALADVLRMTGLVADPHPFGWTS